MLIKPKTSGRLIQVPASPVMEKISEINGTRLKVLLCVLASPEFDPDELCEKLDITKKTFNAAIDYWVAQGALEPGDTAPAKTTSAPEKVRKAENVTVQRPRAVMSASSLPRYTSEEVADYVEAHSGMQKLLDGCQQYMGKMFKPAETEIVVGLLDYLKLDEDYILLLFSYCGRIGKQSLRYVERLAIDLFDKGIISYKELDAHILSMEEAQKLDKPLRRLFGVGNRALTKKEKTFVENWAKWSIPFDMIEKAYEITVENTGSASFPYCNRVLENWHSAGYSTLDEVEKSIEKYKLDKEEAKDKKGSFETDDFFDAALRRSFGDGK